MLQSMVLQRVAHDLATEQQQQSNKAGKTKIAVRKEKIKVFFSEDII